MEADRRLPRSRSALDYEDASGFVRDQPVLVGLDRLDDVPHPLVAAALELLEQEIPDRGAVDDRAVERLVRDVEQPPPVGPEAAAQRHAVRVLRRRGVERPRRRRLPVDDDDALVVLVDPPAADVERVALVHVDPTKTDSALRVLVAAKRLGLPLLQRERRELARRGVERAADTGTHALQARVRVVDVGLLGGEIGMRHGQLSCRRGADGEE